MPDLLNLSGSKLAHSFIPEIEPLVDFSKRLLAILPFRSESRIDDLVLEVIGAKSKGVCFRREFLIAATVRDFEC